MGERVTGDKFIATLKRLIDLGADAEIGRAEHGFTQFWMIFSEPGKERDTRTFIVRDGEEMCVGNAWSITGWAVHQLHKNDMGRDVLGKIDQVRVEVFDYADPLGVIVRHSGPDELTATLSALEAALRYRGVSHLADYA
jgi:hypothetical protein